MASSSSFCSTKFLLFLLLISAVPIAVLFISLESPPSTHAYHYSGAGLLRECSKWDDLNKRFIVSFVEGGLGVVIPVPDDSGSDSLVEEIPVVKFVDDVAGNSSLGIAIDRPRNRVLATITDVYRNRYSGVAAYDLNTWDRLFLTHLSSSGDVKTFVDDVTVDAEGNAYVTDVLGCKIWKVGVTGELLSVIDSSVFRANETWYNNIASLNGIIYHPNGYLLVVHTFTGNLFKVDTKNNNEVKLVKMADSLVVADGIELLSPTKLVVAGFLGSKLVESTDNWETASVVGRSPVLKHRIATTTTIKDGRVYITHALGMGYPKKKHLIVEAIFS